MISCAEAVRRLWDYLDDLASPEDRLRVEEHLAFCRRCCGEAEFAEELHRFLASQAPDEIPEQVRDRLTAILEELES